MKFIIGLLLGFSIGVVCNLFGIPVPAPPVIEGALLVVSMTLGYVLVDKIMTSPASSKHLCGGPSGNGRHTKE